MHKIELVVLHLLKFLVFEVFKADLADSPQIILEAQIQNEKGVVLVEFLKDLVFYRCS